jgi:integrase
MGSLTEIAVRNLKAPERGQVTLTDDGLPGFGLRVSQGGTKSFVLVRGKTRERTLADKELASVFKTALKGTDAFSNIVALLVLIGQRRGEIAALQWSWIDTKERTITLPSSATKNKRAHTFPYGKRTAGILKRVPRASETYVFPASRDKVKGKPAMIFNGWGKPKGAFDRESGVTDWQLHDIRRTFASNLAALGVPLPTIEKLLNHVSGSFGGIVSVYQRYNWLPEMRDAMRKWEARLGELVR